jgi:hypothetical protein
MQKPNDSSLPLLEILIECSKEKQTITYGEAASKLGIHHRVIRHPLHIIQNYCRIYNLPHLTILVVDRNGICGSGKTTVANIGEELIRVYNENWDGILKSFKEADFPSYFKINSYKNKKPSTNSRIIISKNDYLKINNEVYISMEYVSKTIKIKGLINKLSSITKEQRIFYKYVGDKDRLIII